MIETVEAVVDDQGRVRLLQPVRLGSSRRALVVILEEPGVIGDEAALLSEAALADWSRPEEDAACLTCSRLSNSPFSPLL
jgi:hypothetical protein